MKRYKLPGGVKCLVGDGEFLYAGCNNGALYGKMENFFTLGVMMGLFMVRQRGIYKKPCEGYSIYKLRMGWQKH